MFRRLLFFAAFAAGSAQTNLGDTSINGIRCCEPAKGSCTPGLPLCYDVLAGMMTPSPSATMLFRDVSASASPMSPSDGCCDPTKMQCTSTMNICPSVTPSPSAKSTSGSNNTGTVCCDPTLVNCPAGSFICPSASPSSAPSSRPSLSASITGKPSISALPSQSVSMTGRPSNPPMDCCDPAKMQCLSSQPICPSVSASMTGRPSNPPMDCCDPTRMQCSASQPICPSNPPMTDCCDPSKMACTAGQLICPSASTTARPPLACCDPSRMQCTDASQPICPSMSASNTGMPSFPAEACCDPAKFPCPDFVPQCTPGSGTGLPSIPPDACCDPRFMTCPSFAPLCSASASMTAVPTMHDMDCCDPTIFDCPSDAPLCKPSASMTPKPAMSPSASFTSKPTQKPTQRFSLSASFTSKPTPRPIPSTMTGCCDPTRFQCFLGMPICKPTPTPMRSDTVVPAIDPYLCCDPMMARCDGTVRICPSQRPMFSAKPSPIVVRPSQFVNIDSLISSAIDSLNTGTGLLGGSARPTPRPSPSAWIIRNPINLTALGLPRPEAIVSRLSLPSANISEIIKPVRLQELLINLGCTFRMPLENIRITNITMLGSDGKLETIPFDKTLVNLNSSGVVVCLPSAAATSGNLRARRRRLQTSSGSGNNVNVEYAILNPSDDILSLDDAEFQTVVASSALADYQASVGTSASNTAAAPTSSSTSSNSMVDDARVRIGLGVGLGITGFVAMAAIGTLVYRRRKPARRPTASVHVLYTQTSNPINNGEAFNMRVVSDRRVFNPTGSRV